MGNMLGFNDPITRTQNGKDETGRLKFGSSSVQGWRIDMEDAHVQILAVNGNEEISFFAVFDGHGGSDVAYYAKENLSKRILLHPRFREGRFADAIQQAVMQLDQEMFNLENGPDVDKYDLAGSTAVLLLIHRNRIFCGNVGDSRAVASVAGHALDLSTDHKPSSPDEAFRITSAGGFVEGNRVNGNLALSRALGDFFFKRNEHKSLEDQVITAFPDVVAQDMTDSWEFVVMACDGIWDVMTSAEVIEFVRERIAESLPPDQICEDLVLHCLAPDCSMGGLGCDNMTVQLICFLNRGGYGELAVTCSKAPPAERPLPKNAEYHYLKERKGKRLQIPLIPEI
ncbi:probable protein phosphatase 2C T23F11.1 [Paramacrobiotus metropolitanus]|uniref:probable protein phosphatase 2C T23F11.1 n=1 Tax=Paramacrobiotus metropolitanus TaxID=2943436 RepID=UPI002446416C|nr:probable protein phosphatase 2C T23F11.1 [Paramacrobiotus metropolitanus]